MSTIKELWDQKPKDQSTIKVCKTLEQEYPSAVYYEVYALGQNCALSLTNEGLALLPLYDVEGWQLWQEPKKTVTNIYWTAVIKTKYKVMSSTELYKSIEEAKADWEALNKGQGYKVVALVNPVTIEEEVE